MCVSSQTCVWFAHAFLVIATHHTATAPHRARDPASAVQNLFVQKAHERMNGIESIFREFDSDRSGGITLEVRRDHRRHCLRFPIAFNQSHHVIATGV